MRTFLLAALAVALSVFLLNAFVATPAVSAQTADPVVSVQSLVADAADNALVTVRGEIARVVRPEHYVLSDGTAEVELEIDDDLMRPENVRVGMRVEVYGEVDRDLDEAVELEAERIVAL